MKRLPVLMLGAVSLTIGINANWLCGDIVETNDVVEKK